jgi:hypothetical protein
MGSMGYACWAPSPQVGIGRPEVRDLHAMLVVVEQYAVFGVKRRFGGGLNRSSPSLKRLSERNTGIQNENLADTDISIRRPSRKVE